MTKPKLIVLFLVVAVAVPTVNAMRTHAYQTPGRVEPKAQTRGAGAGAGATRQPSPYTLASRQDFRRAGNPFFDRMNLVEDDFRPLEREEAHYRSQ